MREEDLLNRWENLIYRFTNAEDALKYGQIVIDRYNEPHRFYHNIKHLIHVLEQFDFAVEHIGVSQNTAAIIEMAIWYHDAVYNPDKNDNEFQSAELFAEHAQAMDINVNIINDVKRIILVTENHHLASSLDEEIMSDCDLSPLGFTKEGFDKSDKDIRKEYPNTPAIERKKALEKFLKHNGIFKTTIFKKAYESQALENIKEKIESFK